GGAAVAALGVTPLWLLSLLAPPAVFYALHLAAAAFVLAISFSNFITSREAVLALAMPPDGMFDPKAQFLDRWQEFERDDIPIVKPSVEYPASVPAASPAWASERVNGDLVSVGFEPDLWESEQARSPREVLWWLTLEQA